MTLLGKAFSVIIVLLSLAFMVLALAVNATHRNWRDKALALKTQIEETNLSNEQLRDAQQRTQSALDREQAARRTAIASLQTALDQLESELALSEDTVQKKEARNTELAQLDRSRAEELKILTDDNKRLRDLIRKEQEDRDQLFAQTLVLTDQMNALRGIRLELETRNNQLVAQVTRYKEVTDAHGINISDPLDGAPPQRNGTILAVNRPNLLVELSLGHDDGLRPGHLLDVTRSGRYVGKVRVRNADPNRAVAEILPDYIQGIIQENDRVDTTLD
jgi:hypothetical protein